MLARIIVSMIFNSRTENPAAFMQCSSYSFETLTFVFSQFCSSFTVIHNICSAQTRKTDSFALGKACSQFHNIRISTFAFNVNMCASSLILLFLCLFILACCESVDTRRRRRHRMETSKQLHRKTVLFERRLKE